MLVESRRIRDRYRLEEQIGGGAMGTVWRAHDERLDRTVAIKELLLPHDHDADRTEEAKNRAMREARIAARLQHSHAITVFAVIEEEERPWLVMEYLPAKSFSALVKEKPVSVDDAIRIGAQVSSALAAAHHAGIVHRDVKPGNILVAEDGTAKITDFGISRAIGDVKLTATGEIAGTPAYLAPEIARGEEPSFAADVFSLGATLYTAVEGKSPYGTADNAIALLYRASSGDIEPLRNSGRLTPLLEEMLATDPAKRPTMDEVERELAVLNAVTPTAPVAAAEPAQPAETKTEPAPDPAASETTPEVTPVSPSARRGLIAVGAGAVLLCAAVVVAILLIVRQRSPQDQVASPPVTSPPVSSSTSAAPAPAQQSSAPASTSAPATTTAPPSVSTVASQTGPVEAVQAYYGLLPGNLDAGWKLLTDNFKASRHQTFATYSEWWGQFSSISATNVRATGANQVSADITYHRKAGGVTTEHNTFGLVQQNGVWMIDTQS